MLEDEIKALRKILLILNPEFNEKELENLSECYIIDATQLLSKNLVPDNMPNLVPIVTYYLGMRRGNDSEKSFQKFVDNLEVFLQENLGKRRLNEVL